MMMIRKTMNKVVQAEINSTVTLITQIPIRVKEGEKKGLKSKRENWRAAVREADLKRW